MAGHWLGALEGGGVPPFQCIPEEGAVWVAKCWCSCTPTCSCVLGCVLACGFVVSCLQGEGWLLSAACVPWYLPRGNTGLSRHCDPVCRHFCWPVSGQGWVPFGRLAVLTDHLRLPVQQRAWVHAVVQESSARMGMGLIVAQTQASQTPCGRGGNVNPRAFAGLTNDVPHPPRVPGAGPTAGQPPPRNQNSPHQRFRFPLLKMRCCKATALA